MAITADRAFAAETHAPLVEAIGGIAVIVLAILGLANVAENYLLPIQTILFGAVLLVYGSSAVLELSQAPATASTAGLVGGSGLSLMLLAGAAGIVLGILGLLGMHPDTLIAITVIVYGAALMLAGSTPQLRGADRLSASQAQEALPNGGVIQPLGGLVAIVLGLLALTGTNPAVLSLVAFLVLGASVVLSPAMLARMIMEA